MRIEGSKPVSTNKKSDKKGTAASGFSSALAGASGGSEAEESANTGGLTGIAALDGIIGLQEVDGDEGGGQKQAYQRAELTLNALDELRVALLMGEISPSLLKRIERFSVSQKEFVIDPTMRAVLDEIELRAAVEIAKIEMSSYRLE